MILTDVPGHVTSSSRIAIRSFICSVSFMFVWVYTIDHAGAEREREREGKKARQTKRNRKKETEEKKKEADVSDSIVDISSLVHCCFLVARLYGSSSEVSRS